MSDARYTRPTAAPQTDVTHSAAEALDGSLLQQFGAEDVCRALFSVLTESQQERALQALGWVPAPLGAPEWSDGGTEPTAAVHDPEPARWQDKAAAWLRAKADEQDARNRAHPGHADAYPSWRERVDQWRRLADDVERAP